MKISPKILFLVTLMNCSQTNSKTETSDSIKVANDTITKILETQQVAEPVEPEEPPIDSLKLSMHEFGIYPSAVSDDDREGKVLDAFKELLATYQVQKYVVIKKTLTRPDPVMPGTTTEDEIWYFNSEREPRALVNFYKSERTTSSAIYLIEDKRVTGVYTTNDFSDEGATSGTVAFLVSSLCPTCGVSLFDDDGSGYQVSELDQSSVSEYDNEVTTKYEDLRQALRKATDITRTDKEYLVNVPAGTDTVKYIIDPNLVHKFLKKY